MKNQSIKILAAALLCMLAAGCGWQLRGDENHALNIPALTLTSDAPYDKLSRALNQQMEIQHIAKTGSKLWNLRIMSKDMKKNIVAFSDTNNPATYELELQVRFSASNEKGEVVIAPNTERVVRLYEYNNNRRLAMDRETDLLTDEIYNEMAVNLLHRVDFIAGQQKP
jgi:LPS-assembly lipoprotein